MFVFDNYYTFSELLKTAYALALTKLFYRGCTLVRRPFIVRGKPRIVFGKGFTCGRDCRLEVFGEKGDTAKKLVVGSNCKIGDNVHMAVLEKVTIGDNCLMASKIFITDLSHGSYSGTMEQASPYVRPNDRELVSSPVIIGDNVWIGENVCILKGVKVGDGVVIGANSVVTKSIPSNCIAAGSPARIIKQFNTNEGQWLTDIKVAKA